MASFFSRFSEPLLVLDLANNHNGSVSHAKRIIDEVCDALHVSGLQFAIKFQYRDLDTFIHPAHKGDWSLPYVKRFESTRLSWDNFEELVKHVKERGALTACTPFDDSSVDWVMDHGFDILKIASASITDWPLLERVALSKLPVIASTAGATVDEIDRVASFFTHRSIDFALMHCVAAYPTELKDLQLNRIDLLRERYKPVPVGYSTHEDPNDLDAVKMAVAKGARILERHVGVPTEEAQLNAYSSDPRLVRDWSESIQRALSACGRRDGVFEPIAAEIEALRGLRRGVYARNELTENQNLKEKDVFFAIPIKGDQLSANDWSKYRKHVSRSLIRKDEALTQRNLTIEDNHTKVQRIVESARSLFAEARIVLPTRSELEISHHYGIDRFAEFGLLMVTVVNREYCKKFLGILPGQQHPEQWHELKEETFNCIHGQLEMRLDGEWMTLRPGDSLTVKPGVRHLFKSESGCVVEEISSTHHIADSFYTDQAIMSNAERKTFVDFWSKNV